MIFFLFYYFLSSYCFWNYTDIVTKYLLILLTANSNCQVMIISFLHKCFFSFSINIFVSMSVELSDISRKLSLESQLYFSPLCNHFDCFRSISVVVLPLNYPRCYYLGTFSRRIMIYLFIFCQGQIDT